MFDWLPNCVLRENPRAKWVRLKIHPPNRVEIVIPRGFDKTLLPGIVQEKQRWIIKVLKRFAESASTSKETAADGEWLPSIIELRALNTVWRVTYLQAETSRPAAWREDSSQLLITSDDSRAGCRRQLLRWAMHKGYEQLTPRLVALSFKTGLRYSGLTIRNQKTLWGSCSARRRLSLNYKLLFLPQELMDYVLIHELCHTVHLNHSRRFWQLVHTHQPNYQELDRELRNAWRYVPGWAEVHEPSR